MVDKVLFSSKSMEAETPDWLYNLLDAEFRFTLDPCATDDNTKCDEYYTIKEDGLAQPWAPDIVFANPPYGRQVGAWVEKAYRESRKGAVVVMLLATRTSNLWWHDYVMRACEIRFINGRLRFIGARNVAPFPSVIVVFRPGIEFTVPIIGESINAREYR